MESEIPQLLNIIKQELRIRGIRYADIAARMNTSEVTIKRYFSGKGLTLSKLEEICILCGMKLSELYEIMFRRSEHRPGTLSDFQETVLTQNISSAFVFYLLRRGWSASDICKEFRMEQEEMFLLLRVLEKIGLIEILPRNRIRLLTARYLAWSPSGPLRRATDKAMLSVIDSLDADRDANIREIETVKLSERSVRRVGQLIENLMREVLALAEADRIVTDASGEWFSILALTQQVNSAQFFRR